MTEPLSRLYQILDVRWKETDLEALKKYIHTSFI
jgi:hypothetical protein